MPTRKLLREYDVKYVTKWEPPKGDDLRPLIAMPNIPKPLHGKGCQPRTILGTAGWDKMRKACYEAANDTCEICGEKPENKRRRHSHEVFSIDYEKGTSTFVRCFCICSLDHLGCIHTGRAITLYKHDNPLYPKEFLLAGVEKAFRIISEYNRDNPGADLRAYATFLDYLKVDSLRDEVDALIKKYDMKFYMEDPKKMASWGKWKLIIGKKEYPTPYKNKDEWKAAMEEAGKHDSARQLQEKAEQKFSGEVYDELDKILEDAKNDEA